MHLVHTDVVEIEEKRVTTVGTSGTLASEDSLFPKKEFIGTINWNKATHLLF